MSRADYQKMKQGFSDYLLEKKFTPKSIDSHLTVFGQYLKWIAKEVLDIEQVRYNDLLLYMKYCRDKGLTQRTIAHYLIVVRHYYDYLHQAGAVSVNPALDITVKGIKRRSLYKILETGQLDGLYRRYRAETIRQKRNKVILGLLVYQGLRSEELSGLEVGHIQLREGKIAVPAGVNGGERLLELESHQVLEMQDYMMQVRPQLLAMPPKRKYQRAAQTDRLFINEGGSCGHFSNRMTRLMIEVRKLDPQVINARQIRASVIVNWLKRYNLRQVQYLSGHRYISSTEYYLENKMEGLAKEVEQYHPLG